MVDNVEFVCENFHRSSRFKFLSLGKISPGSNPNGSIANV